MKTFLASALLAVTLGCLTTFPASAGCPSVPSRPDDAGNLLIGDGLGAEFGDSAVNNYLFGGGYSIDFGSDNVVVGPGAGDAMTSATRNTVAGSLAGHGLTSGWSNAYYGRAAGYRATTGHYNSGFGHASLYWLIDGQFNSAFGNGSGYLARSAERCVFVGEHAGAILDPDTGLVTSGHQDGECSIYIGPGAAPAPGVDPSNAIAIGARARARGNSQAVIGGEGNDAVTLSVGKSLAVGHAPFPAAGGPGVVLPAVGEGATPTAAKGTVVLFCRIVDGVAKLYVAQDDGTALPVVIGSP